MKTVARRGLVAIMIGALCCVVWLTMPQRGDFIRALPLGVALQSGDVILLGSSTWRGRLLKVLDSDSVYAHTGILDNVEGVNYLVHADPSRNAVVRELLDSYLSSNKIDRVMVMRVENGSGNVAKAVTYARAQWGNARRFNNSFRYGENDGFYCTELVLCAWQSAGVLLLPTVQKGDRIFPSRLLESVRLKCVLECFGNDFVVEQKQQS